MAQVTDFSPSLPSHQMNFDTFPLPKSVVVFGLKFSSLFISKTEK